MNLTSIEASRRACIEAGDLLADGPPRKSEAAVQAGFIDGLFKQGKRWLVNYRTGAQELAVYGYMVGLVLKALKEALPHGQYEAEMKRHFPDVSRAALHRFRQLAERLPLQMPTVGHLTPKLLKLADDDVPEAEKHVIVEAFKQATDSKCVTELLRDTDVIRKTKPPEHHPRKQSTPEEIAASDLVTAEICAKSVIAAIRALMLTEDILPKVPRSLREDVLAECVHLNDAIRRLGKRKEVK